MAPYSIVADVRRHYLHIVLSGYWDQLTFDAFAREYTAALDRLEATGGLRRGLVDGRDFAVQGRAISDQFGELVVKNRHRLAQRTANLVPSHLNKLQAERAGGNMIARYFTDEAEAKAWLAEPDAKAA
jgi:hypothetical protein